jgi:hypothetical protein
MLYIMDITMPKLGTQLHTTVRKVYITYKHHITKNTKCLTTVATNTFSTNSQGTALTITKPARRLWLTSSLAPLSSPPAS